MKGMQQLWVAILAIAAVMAMGVFVIGVCAKRRTCA